MSCSTTSSLTPVSSLDSSSISCFSDKSLSNIKLTQNYSNIINENDELQIVNNENIININELFLIGDQVKLIIDLDLFKTVQENHGGWNSKMSELIGKTGKVHRITEKGDVRVKFDYETPFITKWTIYGFALNRIESNFTIGDSVRLNNDERIVKYLLNENWNDLIKKILGKICKINKINLDGSFILNHNGYEFLCNRDCCYKIFNRIDSTFYNTQDSTKTMITHFKEMTLDNKENSNLDINVIDYLIKKCISGNLNKVKEIISKFPKIIDEKNNGKTALHISCYQGHKEIVEFLIESKSNIEIKDSDGDSAVHYSCFGNQPEILEILAKNKANLNSINKNGCSALTVAVNKLFIQCVQVLLKYNCDINIQDSYGDTPLHDIIGKKVCHEGLEIIDLLINEPTVDLNIKNKKGFNLLHHACLKGNLIVAEKLIKTNPQLINLQKDDGYSGLHLAVLNGHKDLVQFLIKNKTDLELKNIRNQTALLISIAKFDFPIIEILVENSANVNAFDEDLDSCLHLILNETLEKESSLLQSPLKSKLNNFNEALKLLYDCQSICQVLEAIPDDFKTNLRLILSAYLIKNGAYLYSKNKNQNTCLDFINNQKQKDFLINYYSTINIDLNNNDSLNDIILINKCKICDEEPISVNFLPCNHKCVCLDCSIRIKKCLDCNQLIKEKQNVNGSFSSVNSSKLELTELLEKVKNLEEAQLCPICMERKKDTAFQCGHIVCSVCSKPLLNCHICRKRILTKIKIYEN